ncbi:MAG: membrane dipeptidase [Planctomycetota bacterium]|jgi:membrane dipeptidase
MPQSSDNRMHRRDFMRMVSVGFSTLPIGMQALAAGVKPVNIKDMILINALGGMSNQNSWIDYVEKHSDSIGKASIIRMRSVDDRAINDTHTSGTTAINATLGYVAGPEEPYEYTINDIAEWNAIIRQYPDDLLKVWTAEDILKAKKEHRIGVIFGFQNAQSVGEDASRIKTFANLGVRIIQLTYNDRNQIGDGSAVPDNEGLTTFGSEVVEALNENKVLVDLSHSGEKTCLDAIKASNVPITISHTGCRALANLPRNKTDEEIRQVAEKGGVVGIYFMPFLRVDGQARASDVVNHIEHAIKICGEDHVGIGTDGDATNIDDMKKYRLAIAGEIRQRQQAGVSAAGESNQVVPLIPDLMGPSQFQILADTLHSRDHSIARVEKLLGGNFLRLMRDVWQA